MRYDVELVEAQVVRRYKRFLCDVLLPGQEQVTAWCPNPGRMTTCIDPGVPCRVSPATNPKRKLRWTLEQTCMDGTWISVNTTLANAVVHEGIEAGLVPELGGYAEILPEQRYGERSRIDLLLKNGSRPDAWVEVKSTTLRVGDRGLFPDAVTARGTKHLLELAKVAEQGHRAVLFFAVPRGGVTSVGPADEVDPVYGRTLSQVLDRGVEVLAHRVEVRPEGLTLGEALPFTLG